ncbi:MAG: AI-2E family transporter [Ignavibacteria bacterium]|nr:AI-2E family transporter [Ignavibacteria bacterium]
MGTTTNSFNPIIIFGVLFVVLAISLYFLLPVFVLLAFAILLALLVDPIVSLFERFGIHRNRATLLVFIAGIIAVYFILSVFLPGLAAQLANLTEKLQILPIKDQLDIVEQKLLKFFPFLQKGVVVHKFEEVITGSIQSLLGQLTSLASSIFSAAIFVVILPFMTFFIVKDRQKILKGMLHLLPNKYFEMSYWIFKRVSAQLGRYVRGWLIDAAFVGTACGVLFALLGIQNAVALGIIAGIGHLVPYFGPVIGGIPALLLSLIQFGDFHVAPLMGAGLLVIYGLDNGIVQPYVFSKSVDMHPLVIILLIIAGSELFGLAGMLFAVPAATVIKTAASEIYFAMKSYKIARM